MYKVWVMFGWFAIGKFKVVHADSVSEVKQQFIKGCPPEIAEKLTQWGFWLKVKVF
jgi:hypothetical protein